MINFYKFGELRSAFGVVRSALKARNQLNSLTSYAVRCTLKDSWEGIMSFDVFKYKSPVGDIYCVFAGTFLVGLSIRRHPNRHHSTTPLLHYSSGLKTELDAYFAGGLKTFSQGIKFISGTAFEHKVWKALRTIPYGETRSYSWIAERAGSPKAMRAAGQALRKNPLPIILPCHRIIAADGSLGGYSGGITIKRWLLRLEGWKVGQTSDPLTL